MAAPHKAMHRREGLHDVRRVGAFMARLTREATGDPEGELLGDVHECDFRVLAHG